jgi:hypothetical protein
MPAAFVRKPTSRGVMTEVVARSHLARRIRIGPINLGTIAAYMATLSAIMPISGLTATGKVPRMLVVSAVMSVAVVSVRMMRIGPMHMGTIAANTTFICAIVPTTGLIAMGKAPGMPVVSANIWTGLR